MFLHKKVVPASSNMILFLHQIQITSFYHHLFNFDQSLKIKFWHYLCTCSSILGSINRLLSCFIFDLTWLFEGLAQISFRLSILLCFLTNLTKNNCTGYWKLQQHRWKIKSFEKWNNMQICGIKLWQSWNILKITNMPNKYNRKSHKCLNLSSI